MELKILNLERKNEELKKKKLDRSKWREWDTNQVFNFMMSTVGDGGLDKYEESIKEGLVEGEFIGKDLGTVTEDNLKNDLGIKNFGVKKAVFQAIQELTQPQLNPVAEGIDLNAPTAYL